MIDVSVNGKTHRVDVDPDTPLLWVLRESIGLTGHEVRLRRWPCAARAPCTSTGPRSGRA